MTTGLPRLAECRDCTYPIRFVRMEGTGKALPVNPLEAHERGTIAARFKRTTLGTSLFGYVIAANRPGTSDYPHRFIPHYATCEAKRPATKPAPAPEPTLF